MGQVDPFPELTELFCWIHNPVSIYLTRSYRVLVKPFCVYIYIYTHFSKAGRTFWKGSRSFAC